MNKQVVGKGRHMQRLRNRNFLWKVQSQLRGSCLSLSDFCPDVTLTAANDRKVAISHAELAHLLKEAAEEENVAEAPSSPISSEKNIPFVSKRKRTPPPKPVSEDEEAFEQAETAARSQESAENSSFSSAELLAAGKADPTGLPIRQSVRCFHR